MKDVLKFIYRVVFSCILRRKSIWVAGAIFNTLTQWGGGIIRLDVKQLYQVL